MKMNVKESPVSVVKLMPNFKFWISVCCLLYWFSNDGFNQSELDNNLIINPGIEEIANSIDQVLDVAVGLGNFRRPWQERKKSNIAQISVEPYGWRKFCSFNGTAFGGVNEHYAFSGNISMRIRINWRTGSNQVMPGNIAASLLQPMEPGCDYRFGIWVARSPDDPERINNGTLRIKGIQGKARSLEYSPEDSAYLEFQIPLHEMEVGEYRYYEGDFTALSDDTHLYIEIITDEFVFGRKARRIHRRCNNMRGGCHPITLASIIFDDVSLVDISGCNEKKILETEAEPEEVVEIGEFISFSAFYSDWVNKDTLRYYFHHDHPHLTEKELTKLIHDFQYFEGRVVSVHGFTDSTGTIQYNRELSLKRAEYISDQLQELGIHQEFEISSKGSCTEPSCNSPEECRRVEVILKSYFPMQDKKKNDSMGDAKLQLGN